MKQSFKDAYPGKDGYIKGGSIWQLPKHEYSTLLDDAQRCLANGEYAKAEEILKAIPSNEILTNAQLLYVKGCLEFVKENFAEALRYFESATIVAPNNHIAHNNKGVLLERMGKTVEALAAYEEAILQKNDYYEALCNLGLLLESQGQPQKAVEYFVRAERLDARNAKVYKGLGLAYSKMQIPEEAIRAFKKALEFDPNSLEIYNNLGSVLILKGRLSEAFAVFKRALALAPTDATLLNNLGQVYLVQGNAPAALEYYRQAMQNDSNNLKEINSNYLFTLNYIPELSPQTVAGEHVKWGSRFSGQSESNDYANDRSSTRRLKIGYVSPDFYSHSVTYFFESILEQHDRKNFEVYLYNTHPYYADQTTDRLRNLADGWRDIARLSDEEAYGVIRKDEIDILIDLAGHTAKNRLMLFARKPAPIQVSWIGYPNTTGLKQIDYRFTDDFADPSEDTDDSLYVEQLIRLPRTFLCYRPRKDVPEVGRLPADVKGYITFGSFNNLAKTSAQLVVLWSRILKAVPKSKMLLKSRGLGDDGVKKYFLNLFKDNGVSADRIEFVERHGDIREHFAVYNKVDIALDTFPYHGTTTTCDALWMGVPVVCLAGNSHVSRVGVSLLNNISLAELIAANEEEYIKIAVGLAKDSLKLTALRGGLREKMNASLLLDGKFVAANVEQEYRKMWERWSAINSKSTPKAPSQKGSSTKKMNKKDNALEAMRAADALVQEGIALVTNKKGDEAITAFESAIKVKPDYAEAHYRLATTLKYYKRWEDAVREYRKVIELQPEHPEAYASLGAILHTLDKREEALDYYQKALMLNPQNHALLHNFAVCLKESGKIDKAKELLEKAVAIKPNYVSAYYNLLLLYKEKGDWDQVIANGQKILEIEPKHLDTIRMLGAVLKGKGMRELSEKYLMMALELQPEAVDVLNTLGNLLTESGRILEAVEIYQKAIAINPKEAITYCNLAGCLAKQGKSKETLECFRRALELDPTIAKLHSNILLALAYLDDVEAETVYQEHLKWEQQHAAALYPQKRHLSKKQKYEDGQRIKIGYLSPDFRFHSVAFFIEAVLIEHDRSKVEIVLYSDAKFPDEMTGRLAAVAEHWRDISRMNDQQVYELICNDKIDILVDLAGHTADNRMLVFARKPAPVQVTWIGYPNTTGLKTIDYRFTDNYADPVGMTDEYHSEELLRLNNSFLCFRPRINSVQVKDLPYLKNHYITFGSFNNFNKVSPQIARLWAEILHKTPQSRLLLKSGGLGDSFVQERTFKLFKELGIGQERIVLLGPIKSYVDHLEKYNEIDIALDAFPYHGTTTTCEALWMGIPVVALAGNTHVSRVGVSLLCNVGLPEWVAATAEEYVRIAVEAANSIEKLRELRLQLREQMEKSPLMQAKAFVVNLENTYERIWWRYRENLSYNPIVDIQDNMIVEKLISNANTEYKNGNVNVAQLTYEKILTCQPQSEVALHGLGLLLSQQGDFEKGISLLQQAIVSKPDYFEAIYNLALICKQKGDRKQAVELFERAHSMRPQHLGAIMNLAQTYKDMVQADKSSELYQKALTISPGNVDIINEWGFLLSQCGKCSQAVALLKQGLSINPENTTTLRNLGFACKLSGNVVQALEYYRAAIKKNPSLQDVQSAILFTLNFLPAYNKETIFREHKQWAVNYADHFKQKYSKDSLEVVKGRLKIGYVSFDFREHSVAYFLEPVLEAHDRQQFEIYLYNNNRCLDETSNRFKNLADTWIDIYDLDDEAVTRRICSDGIDILVDLSGHTAGNRLMVFAHKPAPVQVTWIGYPNTTGLAAMDYRITDYYADPEGLTDSCYTEKLIRMSKTFLCYSPGKRVAEITIEAKRNSTDGITYGCFNNLAKITVEMITVWAKILLATPNSRLLLKSTGLADSAVQNSLKQQFVQLGVDAERIILHGFTATYGNHMEMYQGVDIALDTFPYNGTTTTCEALWMGVPVVTLAGDSHVSRVGVSLLQNVGLKDLIALNETEYINIAVALANDTSRLELSREKVRLMVRNSPLLDSVRFTKELENHYREIWGQYWS